MPSPEPGLQALLRPKSLVVVGVPRQPSQQPTMNGSTILQSLTRFEFPGRIDIVHPSGEVIAGRQAAASIEALPEPADLIVLALPAASVPATIAEAGRRGIRGAVVMSAGFSELANEEGTRLGRELEQAAGTYGVRVCGPNGLGYINVWDRVLAGYFPCLLSSSALPKAGGLSIVTQSGAVGNSLLARAMDRGIGTSFVISSGNEANVSLADYLDFLVEDPNTKVIASYLEGVTDGARLKASLRRCTESGKPVVVYKVGKSSSGAKAALSHTAKVAGEPALYRGMFRQLGVVEAQHLDDLIEIPMLFLKSARRVAAPPRGIGVVSISGGLGAIMADHFVAEGFDLPELSPRTRARLAALPVKLGSTTNPVDLTAAIQRTESTIADILKIVAEDERVDAIVFPNAARFPGPALNVAGVMADAAESVGKPLLSVWYAGADNAAAVSALHGSQNVACFDDPAACARAFAALRDFRRITSLPPQDIVRAPSQAHARAALGAPGAVLNEAKGKDILAAYGVAVPREALARSASEAADAAASIGFPVALKIVSADIAHKAKVGGVKLALASPDDVERAYARMLDEVATHVPHARIDGVLVSEMVAVKAELLVGAYREPQFGPVLVVGIGGGQVEALPDIAMRLLPATARDCRTALDELQDRRLRLLDPDEKDAISDTIARIAMMAWDLSSHMSEVDVNPIALTADGHVVALDALMTLSK